MGEEIPGGMAEYVRVSADNLIRFRDLDFAVAAAVPIAYGTAIRDAVRDRPDQAVRSYSRFRRQRRRRDRLVLQFAKMIGAARYRGRRLEPKMRTPSPSSALIIRSTTSTQDFSREAWKLSGKNGVDVMVNYTGGDTWMPSLRALKQRGKLLTCGATAGTRPATTCGSSGCGSCRSSARTAIPSRTSPRRWNTSLRAACDRLSAIALPLERGSGGRTADGRPEVFRQDRPCAVTPISAPFTSGCTSAVESLCDRACLRRTAAVRRRS